MNIEIIDFTNGIKSSVLNKNFQALKDAIYQERLLTAGSGISNGLNLTIQDDFKVRISAGTLVDTNGEDITFSNPIDFEISKPFLKTISEKLLVNSEGAVYLSHIPYAQTRDCALTLETMNELHIVQNTTQFIIAPRSLKDKQLFVDASFANTYITVTYNYAEVRYDTIYINKANKIVIAKGTSATSSSIYIPDSVESKAILYVLKIDPLTKRSDCYYASLSQLTSINSLRNVYTDSEGNFYIGGIRLNDLKFINTEKPVNPQDKQFWFDSANNILYNFNTQNGISDWQAVNNQSSIANYETYLWRPEENPSDGQTFLFDYQALNLHYVPHKNALTLIADQYVLHSDQYEEITYNEAINDIYLKSLLIDKGYPVTGNTLDERYENIGIGFRLKHPLGNPSYVEARVFHAVSLDQNFERFQRSATFITENYLTISEQTTVKLLDGYRYHENQLTLFVDGYKLIPEIDYEEGNGQQVDGEITNIITLKNQYRTYKGILNYRIITNVYSYDHVEAVVASHLSAIEAYKDSINAKMENVDKVIEKYTTLKTNIETIQGSVVSHEYALQNYQKNLPERFSVYDNHLATTANLPQELSDLKTQLQDLNRKLESLTDEVQNLSNKQGELGRQLTAYKESLDTNS